MTVILTEGVPSATRLHELVLGLFTTILCEGSIPLTYRHWATVVVGTMSEGQKKELLFKL